MHPVVEEIFPRLGEPVERRPLPTSPELSLLRRRAPTLVDGR